MLALAALFLTHCANRSRTTTADAPPEGTGVAVTAPADAPPPAADTLAAAPDGVATTAETAADEPAPPLETEAPQPVTPTTANGTADLAARTASDDQLATVLENIARDLEARNLAYRGDLGQDCSGIYHQIKDSIQVRIPALAGYRYPSFSADRNSRQIADWYYRNNNLHIVQDARADGNLIRPGCVMFYSRTDERYGNLTIELLTNPGKFVHDGANGKIMHVAVVTSVEKDEAGNVIKYTIMHGRNSRYNASRSSGNWDGPGSFQKQFAKFPFGNWNQQWVAMAHIETPK